MLGSKHPVQIVLPCTVVSNIFNKLYGWGQIESPCKMWLARGCIAANKCRPAVARRSHVPKAQILNVLSKPNKLLIPQSQVFAYLSPASTTRVDKVLPSSS